MLKNWKTFLAGLVSFLCLVWIIGHGTARKESYREVLQKILPVKEKSAEYGSKLHEAKIMDRQMFFREIGKFSRNPQIKEEAVGGIIPHHLLPSFMIADFFARLSSQNIETVVIVGPNHYESGNFNVQTSDFGWNTDFGIVAPEKNLVSLMVSKKLASIEDGEMEREHSISGLMPFLKYYLPTAKMVPVTLKGGTSDEEIESLAGSLGDFLGKGKSVMVASVDFSHDLTNSEAKDKDEYSIRAIREHDYVAISNFDNAYVDSPASIKLFLKTMEIVESENMSVLGHTNSGEMLKDNFSPVTSYFSIVFAK